MDTGPDLDRLDPPAGEGGDVPEEPPFHERELRPAGRLRLWQTLPIAGIGILGALMFGFPLAFENNSNGGGGAVVVGMLGLLLVAASVGWGAVAARRAGYKLPGLPRPDADRRASWRVLLCYAAVGAFVLALAVWRVARLRG
jgi:hypothetical protein